MRNRPLANTCIFSYFFASGLHGKNFQWCMYRLRASHHEYTSTLEIPVPRWCRHDPGSFWILSGTLMTVTQNIRHYHRFGTAWATLASVEHELPPILYSAIYNGFYIASELSYQTHSLPSIFTLLHITQNTLFRDIIIQAFIKYIIIPINPKVVLFDSFALTYFTQFLFIIC